MRLYIFGTGHVGCALAERTKNLNYIVTVVDSRKEVLEGVPADRIIHARYDRVFENDPPPPGGYFVVATYSHILDLQILRRVFDCEPAYVGILASKNKGETLMSKLYEDVGNRINWDVVFTPMGLDIGGNTSDEEVKVPEMIALIDCMSGFREKYEKFKKDSPSTLEKSQINL